MSTDAPGSSTAARLTGRAGVPAQRGVRTLARMVADGIRGVTANPAIITKAIVGSTDVAGFHTSDQEVPAALVAKADQLGRR